MALIALFILLTLTLSSHARESQFFSKQSQPLNTNNQQPNFIPQTEDSGSSYGLYGHGSGQLPPSATANDLPENYNPVAYTTPIHTDTTTQDFPNEFNNPQQYRYNNRNSMYDNNPQQYRYNSRNSMYNSEKQGMSDTRFLENGKYYYDLNMENSNANVNMNRGFNSRNGYNTQGNNGNSYDRYNSNGGYENQEELPVDQYNP